MPPAAGWDTMENVQAYEEGSAVAPTTWTNTASPHRRPVRGVDHQGPSRGRGDGRVTAHADRRDEDVALLHACRHRDCQRRRPVRERGRGRTGTRWPKLAARPPAEAPSWFRCSRPRRQWPPVSRSLPTCRGAGRTSRASPSALPPEVVAASARSIIEPGGAIVVFTAVANTPISTSPGPDVFTDGAVILPELAFAWPRNASTGAAVFTPE